MARRALLRSVLALALLASPAAAQLAWRFGIEDTWAQLGGLLTPAQKVDLAAQMAGSTAAQFQAGDVNVNGMAGGWLGMQAQRGAAIDFRSSDALVQLAQRHGFSIAWNLRINATWASAGNTDCYDHGAETNCAPDAAHEQDLYDYVRAVAERYDGDGVADMPGLLLPVRFYVMTGEIEFAGATPPPQPGFGDAARNHFWSDSIADLLRTHRIVYRAIHDADPSGRTRLVGSGGVLWDLYSDFPDYPQVEGPTVAARLTGQNDNHAPYVQSFARLKQMLSSFGDDGDGLECDLVGWHPHMSWRDIPQSFALIHTYAGAKPIYVDDMWTNLFLSASSSNPGNTLFTDGGVAVTGDFPNPLVATYGALRSGVGAGGAVRDWYLERTGRNLVKAFAAAFGEGAEHASFSGNADFAIDRAFGLTGWLNLLGTAGEGFAPHPAWYDYRLLVAKLHDFTGASAVPVSTDPRTRVYRFDRPRGPLFVAWSETGGPPPGLDYGIATGETVALDVGAPHVLATHLVRDATHTEPSTESLATAAGRLTLALGHEPVLLEPAPASCTAGPQTLCLDGGRFQVSVTWRTDEAHAGSGNAVPLTPDTGFFWFFDPANVELIVKLLDACSGFGRHWVFAAGLTDVWAQIEVVDTRTGARRSYVNPAGEPFAPVQDTAAFACP